MPVPPKRAAHAALSPCAFLAALLLALPAVAQGVLQPGFDQSLLGTLTGRTRAWGVAVADFTSDGIADVVSGDTSGDVHLFEGQGDGTFVDRGIVINLPFNDAYAIAAADFDRDGRQDFAAGTTSGTAVPDGTVLLYLGNGNGTFQSTPGPSGTQLGLAVGDAGTDVFALAAGDVDGDGDVDLVAGERSDGAGNTADVVLFRNQLEILGGALAWTSALVLAGTDRGFSPLPSDPPYFVPNGGFEGYGLALGDVDGDGAADLLVGDQANYLYVYRNQGAGMFAPILYDRVPGGTRPFAFDRLHANFTFQLPLAAADLNGDGLVDFASAIQAGDNGDFPAEVDVWLNAGPDGAGRPLFVGGGVVSDPVSGTDARGLAAGQLNPAVDLAQDLVFGNYETVPGGGAQLFALLADLTDSDADGIIDDLDNAPLDFNPPLLDMNTDGGLNRFDQLDADADGVGDPADPDDDEDGLSDESDLCPLVADPDQADSDGDGRGDACDPRHDVDSDADGVSDGPLEPDLLARALAAKGRWARSDTHFVIRIDALSRVFQNEFVQVFTDAAILDAEGWDARKFDSYNEVGDAPALPGYQVPADLPGGRSTPVTLITIPRLLFDAFGDSDPIRWINDRNADPELEIGQHGTYHANNTPLSDWVDQPDRFFFSCDECGFPLEAVFQYLRIGRRTLLGQYELDPWILQSGADPFGSPRIDWSDAANPLISYAPPFNASDPASREAESRLGYRGFSASRFEEESPIFTPEGSHHEQFDSFGMFHASADLEVEPEAPSGQSYAEYLESITQPGTLNTWLIEEVEWSTRYCNDAERLTPCAAAPGGVNRENNMVDVPRWQNWLALLDHANATGEVMTLGDYALAVATDNCRLVANAGQADGDADGIGDACDVDRIDIMPGVERNVINVRALAPVSVAILGSPALDVALVDGESLAFGPDGATPVFPLRVDDVNDDGSPDLVAQFRIRQTGIAVGDTEACLAGVVAGTAFLACDTIVTGPTFACGMGFEVAFLLAPLLWLPPLRRRVYGARRRRR